MRNVTPEFSKLLASRLKIGNNAEPVCRVEIDRLTFIPGETRPIKLADIGDKLYKELDARYFAVEDLPVGTPEPVADISYKTTDMVYPVKGHTLNDGVVTVSQGFTGQWPRGHSGIDLAGASDYHPEIVATWSGVVHETSARTDSYGTHVKMTHESGFKTIYAHMVAGSLQVKTGDKVKAGTVLGRMGSTGHSTDTHLHFEVLSANFAVNPLNYLDGTYKTNLQNMVFETDISVVPPAVSAETNITKYSTNMRDVWVENFERDNWANSSRYTVGNEFNEIASVEHGLGTELNPHSYLMISFMQGAVFPDGIGFSVMLESAKSGCVDIGFSTDFTVADGDSFKIIGDGKETAVTDFRGLNIDQEIKGIYIPPNSKHTLAFLFNHGGSSSKVFRFNYIKYQEGDSYSQKGVDQKTNDAETEFLYGDGAYKIVEVPTGSFIYDDTLRLNNVVSLNVNNNVEAQSADAQVTITNPDGYYSPDYNPFNFPELYQESPWSFISQNYQMGVIGDNAPIRIYLGYGLEEIRVFTGLVDKVDMSGDTLTITARDMYKKIINKVVTEDLRYPRNFFVKGKAPVGEDKVVTPMDVPNNLIWKDRIIIGAWNACNKVNDPENVVDYKILLAVARHETVMGTAGWGRPNAPDGGGWVLGLDCTGSNSGDHSYGLRFQGIENQMKAGAAHAIQTLGGNCTFNSWNDVEQFRTGGPNGEWCAGTAWTDAVWGYFQEITTKIENQDPDFTYEGTPVGSVSLVSASATLPVIPTPDFAKELWVKSAIVHDLVGKAGMFGWRDNEDDAHYPDVIIEETVLIQLNQSVGRIIKATPNVEGEFYSVDASAEAVASAAGWINPFVDSGKEFLAFSTTIASAIEAVIEDTGLVTRCDRYGTFRMEKLDIRRPVVATYRTDENIVSLAKTIDHTRSRSHIVVRDGNGQADSFLDKELLIELKGEMRSMYITVPWVRGYEMKKKVVEKLFFDMKRLARTLQVVIPGDPSLDMLDRVMIYDKYSATADEYIIKGIKHGFSDSEFTTSLELTWAADGTVI